MAKINPKDVQMINHKLLYALPNHGILDYDIVTFKNGIGRYAPKSELLVVKSATYSQPMGANNSKLTYTTFLIERETLCNEIESLIKL